MKKVVRNILICLYFIVSFFVTYCLITYNNYSIAEFKDKYIFTLKKSNSKYSKGDLLITNKNNKYSINDDIFYYKISNSDVDISINKIVKVDNINNRSIYKLDNDKSISGDKIIGTTKNTKSYAIIGSIYSVLISRWGYLIFIILPILSLFIYEIYQIIKEIRAK